MPGLFSNENQVTALTEILEAIASHLNLRCSVRLWNGDIVPLGRRVDPTLLISISSPGVVGTLVRRPNLETFTRLYAKGLIDFHGGDLLEIYAALQPEGSSKKALRKIRKRFLAKRVLPFVFTKTDDTELENRFSDDMIGRRESTRNNTDYIQFHYDVSNEFYQLFLDPEMLYSCAYFTDWNNSLAVAQQDKLEMICRKLRLQPGESMLDIGCGWGGLICYAAQNYGVTAHGVTLSQTQYDFAKAKIEQLGLDDRVTVEIRDYQDLDGHFDKIASVGMFEHIGIANYAKYFTKVRSLLADRGILLNHAIARNSKKSKRNARKIRPERKLILKYIFPGSELTSAGFTQDAMEQNGFEVHDVEAWREHYALTCRHWCKRLSANKEKAIELVGYQRYRLWIAYLAGVSAAFDRNSIKIYQIVATKRSAKRASGMPPTRSDLYVSEGDTTQTTGQQATGQDVLELAAIGS